MARVLAIPDLHAPFQHKRAIEFLVYVYKHFKCDMVICLGDELDFHALSRWPKNPDGHSAGFEFSLGLAFLKELYSVFPNVRVVHSNHTSRPYKKAYEYGLMSALLKDYKTLLEAPDGWSWHEKIEQDNVLYLHGEGFSGQNAHTRAAMLNRKSTVIGHIHSFGGVQYMQSYSDRIFAMNAGCLIDVDSYSFAYAKTLANKPTLGCGVVLNGENAFFCPLSD